jgi:hypothetical protein
MKIYEIDKEIEALLNEIDEETGEILFDPEKLDALQMERDRKVENLALAVKNLTAEAAAIKAEKDALYERQKATERDAERAKKYLEFVLNGEKFETARVAVSYRSSSRLEVDEGFIAWAKRKAKSLLTIREPEPNKTAIKEALKKGEKVPHVQMVTAQNMQIK